MRIPFLKIDQDALVRARTMSRLLKQPLYAGIGIANELFAWALDMAPEHNGEVDLSGRIADEDPAALIAAAVGWEGDPRALLVALIRVGFVAPVGSEPARVKGLDRYLDALPRTPEQRSEQAKRAADVRWSGRPPPPTPSAPMLKDAPASGSIAPALLIDARAVLIDAQTQTQTQTQRKTTTTGPTPEDLVVGEEFWGPTRDDRRELELDASEEPPPGWTEFAVRKKRAGFTPRDVRGAHMAFVRDPDFLGKRWPVAVFLSPKVYAHRLKKLGPAPPPADDPNDYERLRAAIAADTNSSSVWGASP